jgi:hypothetical protein
MTQTTGYSTCLATSRGHPSDTSFTEGDASFEKISNYIRIAIKRRMPKCEMSFVFFFR